MTRLVLRLALALVAACGDDDSGPPPAAAELIDDVRALQEIIGDDTAAVPLDEVDDMVSTDRPVAAADLLRTGAIPAAQRHLERVRALSMGTSDGRRLHRDLVTAYEARLSSLEQYASVLDRGPVEDLALAEALGAQREATVAILEVDRRLAAIRPLPEGAQPQR